MIRFASFAKFSIAGLVCFLSSIAQAVPTYTLVDLGSLGGTISVPHAINDHGEIVGYSYLPTNSNRHAFYWSVETGMIDLHDLVTWPNSDATDINDQGQIVGSFDGFGSSRGFLHSNGATQLLGGSISSDARGINALGQVVGTNAAVANQSRGYVWTANDGLLNLGTLGGSRSVATDINTLGAVVGGSLLDGDTEQHAFVWTSLSGMTSLGTLGGSISLAEAINDDGFVVGSSQMADSGVLQHAFLYDGNSLMDLGTLGGNSSAALDINNLGQVVGSAHDASGASRAFLYEGGEMLDLNALVLDRGTVLLRGAQAINSRGWIVANGFANGIDGEQRAYLLMPVPEIQSAIYAVQGLSIGAAALRIRRKARRPRGKNQAGSTLGGRDA